MNSWTQGIHILVFSSFMYILRSGIAGSENNFVFSCFFFFLGTSMWFSAAGVPFCIPTMADKDCNFFKSSATILFLSSYPFFLSPFLSFSLSSPSFLPDNSYPNEYEVCFASSSLKYIGFCFWFSHNSSIYPHSLDRSSQWGAKVFVGLLAGRVTPGLLSFPLSL